MLSSGIEMSMLSSISHLCMVELRFQYRGLSDVTQGIVPIFSSWQGFLLAEIYRP